MHENAPILTAEPRERTGSRYAKRLRDRGGLPAIIYGHGEQPTPVSLDAKDAIQYISRGEKVFQVQMDGQSSRQVVLLKDLQFDYLGSNIIHADLARVDLDERVTSRVSVHLTGDAVGLNTSGAVLMHPTSEIEIECELRNLPDYVEVDVTDLDVGGVITAGEVKLPGDTITLLTDEHAVIAQINVQQEEATDEASEVSAEGAGEPEVLSERKSEDEDQDKKED